MAKIDETLVWIKQLAGSSEMSGSMKHVNLGLQTTHPMVDINCDA